MACVCYRVECLSDASVSFVADGWIASGRQRRQTLSGAEPFHQAS